MTYLPGPAGRGYVVQAGQFAATSAAITRPASQAPAGAVQAAARSPADEGNEPEEEHLPPEGANDTPGAHPRERPLTGTLPSCPPHWASEQQPTAPPPCWPLHQAHARGDRGRAERLLLTDPPGQRLWRRRVQ